MEVDIFQNKCNQCGSRSMVHPQLRERALYSKNCPAIELGIIKEPMSWKNIMSVKMANKPNYGSAKNKQR